ncbi:hypothetical protein HH310_29810 [Actinoplanes sp. TBRC 11911]|uniref:hypothetical protein n=1 Tax=Actinoplanes sp. TBRC 11911 TaxID=2729386 RepID=UPI00145F939A|nr:hypothetical protein [Actinoplanes sp. TBRC 11911]NMO55366.1 hypothetical protein [Actinoplanes sp. TBRC 11911]
MRTDLQALTADILAELTNRGLVKRAARDIERMALAVTEDDAGTVRATYPDGNTASLPVGELDEGTCGCGATGVCRHLVGLVLAYQTSVAPQASAGSRWSPGEFSDDQVMTRIGERAMAAARRGAAAGYVARVHRGGPDNPVPSVELPAATVRFLVPHDLRFARSDAAAGTREDVLALAVWAFRAADERAPGTTDVHVQVGGTAAREATAGLDSVVALAGRVLREGAVHLDVALTADIAVVRRDLEAARMRWPLLAVDDLVAQLAAYRKRSARYRPESLADHIAELAARRRAVANDGSALRSRVLGTDEASETPLRRARLDGLGARVSALGGERTVDLFLAHADSATVLVLRRAYETEDAGPQLAARRIAGVSVGTLASGVIVTESAVRSASRAVRLSTRQSSRTEVMTARALWQDLPRNLIAEDLSRLADELDVLPPRPIRARVEAEMIRIIPVAEVRSIEYAPGAQRLDAVIADVSGATAVVSTVHASWAPGRLDAVAAALRGSVRYVSGSVRHAGGSIFIDPIGFAVAGDVVVPDLRPADRGTAPGGPARVLADPLALALDEAMSLLAELVHRGLQHTPMTMNGRLRDAATRLRGLGLRRTADAIDTFTGLLGPDPGEAAVTAWVDAYLRLSLAAELR